ncbi:hypothetical protein [Nostoc sp.]|uniref:hypothetical protein n=1 Tax=Nostoc sp. TaxID=1180 RepID=UPI002FFD4B65
MSRNGWSLLKTLIDSLQPETQTETPEYPLTQFYGCIQDETLDFLHKSEIRTPPRQSYALSPCP